MKLPKFIQIAVAATNYDRTYVALDEAGKVWRYNREARQWCQLGEDRIPLPPPPAPPKPTLDDCLIQPPTPEQEAQAEVERLLA